MKLSTTRVCVRTMGRPARKVSVFGVLTMRRRWKGNVVTRRVHPTARTTTHAETIVGITWEAPRQAIPLMVVTVMGLRRMFAVPLVVHPLVARLPLVVMRGVVGDLPYSLPIGRIHHRLRRLVRVMEPAAGDSLPGPQPVVARRPEMPAVVYS